MEIRYPFTISSSSPVAVQTDQTSELPGLLHRGEIPEARMGKAFDPSRTSLIIEGRHVTTRPSISQRQEEALLFEVLEAYPVIRLKLLGARRPGFQSSGILRVYAAILESLRSSALEAMGHHEMREETLTPFKALLNELSSGVFQGNRSALLSRLIDKSGVNWESKLKQGLLSKRPSRDLLDVLAGGDLKGLGSRILATEGDTAFHLKELVHAITDIQLLNHKGFIQQGKIFLPVPIQFPAGHFAVGQLLLRFPHKNDHDRDQPRMKRTYRIAFLMELSHLGPLRADLLIRGKEIWGKFLVGRDDTRQKVMIGLPELTGILTEKGFHVRVMECHLKDSKTIRACLLDELYRAEDARISLFV